MTNNQHRPFRQEQYVNDVEASVEIRAWLEAIASGDVERAREVATSHVRTSKQLALAVLFEDRELSASG